MKKVILVDGNNLLFRSYYATAYAGKVMKNGSGMPTNALYGFVSMINKILAEEEPEYMAVAFDIGKNFRKQKYETYKSGRNETPEELKVQLPLAREILKAMGIAYFELEPYEADDIIGTLARMCDETKEFKGTIISSDKDLLQLISKNVDMKLLKTKDYIKYTIDNFKDDWGFAPIHMIDFKALAGDASDNIPGVHGIGEKSAIALLKEYNDIEEIYKNIDDIKNSMKTKLEKDKESAFISKEIATIYKEVPLNISLEDVIYKGPNIAELNKLYEELDFTSFLKKVEKKEEVQKSNIAYQNASLTEHFSKLEDTVAIYIECDQENYHLGNIIGASICDSSNNYFVPAHALENLVSSLKNKKIITFDHKKNYVLLQKENLEITCDFDTMIAAYLLNLNVKEDIAYLMHSNHQNVSYYAQSLRFGFEKTDIVAKARFIYDTYKNYEELLEKEEMQSLFYDIEMPLIEILASMEIEGIKVDKNILDNMEIELSDKKQKLENEIYELAGEQFNISSPKQLGVMLFEKLALPYAKKTKTGYKTDVNILNKLKKYHPIIDKILEYRLVTKLQSTYIEGMSAYILQDGKIHTIYKQNLTRTGRLSSTEPNLQNIPTKDEDGKKIRKAFIPVFDEFLSADYSQMELRVLAHISNCKELQEAFLKQEDIHTRVAADINGISLEEVTPLMRKMAKAVVFGIVYGISGFGLGENLEITSKEAKEFINKFYDLYPGVKDYMDTTIQNAYENGYVRTLFNRKRIVEELSNKNYMIRQSGERIAMNTPIQGTSADIMKLAMVKVAEEMKKQKLKSKMLLQVHDELIFDCVKEEKEILAKIVKENMENCIKLSVPIIVSNDFGRDWYETK